MCAGLSSSHQQSISGTSCPGPVGLQAELGLPLAAEPWLGLVRLGRNFHFPTGTCPSSSYFKGNMEKQRGTLRKCPPHLCSWMGEGERAALWLQNRDPPCSSVWARNSSFAQMHEKSGKAEASEQHHVPHPAWSHWSGRGALISTAKMKPNVGFGGTWCPENPGGVFTVLTPPLFSCLIFQPS